MSLTYNKDKITFTPFCTYANYVELESTGQIKMFWMFLESVVQIEMFECFQSISRKLNIIEFPGWFKSMCWIEQVIYYIARIDHILLNDVALYNVPVARLRKKNASETRQCKYYTTDCTWQYYKTYFQDNIVSYRIHSGDGTIIKKSASLGSLNELPNSQEEQSDHRKSDKKYSILLSSDLHFAVRITQYWWRRFHFSMWEIETIAFLCLCSPRRNYLLICSSLLITFLKLFKFYTTNPIFIEQLGKNFKDYNLFPSIRLSTFKVF